MLQVTQASPRVRTQVAHGLLAVALACWASLGAGCSFQGSFHAGSSTTSEDAAREHRAERERKAARERTERERQARERSAHEHANAHEHPHVRADGACDSERCVTAKRRADDDLARVERETNERVAQAEREAKEQERAAEEQAERERQQAHADAEAKQREADAAAAAQAEAKPRSMRRNDLSGTVFHKSADDSGNGMKKALQESLARRNGEIDASALEKKTLIRKKLDQTKADILVAAERKRNEIHAQLKQDASENP